MSNGMKNSLALNNINKKYKFCKWTYVLRQ